MILTHASKLIFGLPRYSKLSPVCLCCLCGWAKNLGKRKHHAKQIRRGKRCTFMQANRAIICQLFTLVFFNNDTAIFAAARRHILTAVHIFEDCVNVCRVLALDKLLRCAVLFFSRNNRFEPQGVIKSATRW